MNYCFYEEETGTRAKVMLVYHIAPPEELLSNGNYIVVEEIVNPEIILGKSPLPYCNPQTNEFWYEYVDRPLTPEELVHQQQDQIDQLTILLGDALLGGM